MRLSPRLTLNNGVLIDRLGFGLYKVPPGDAASLVTMAVETGYRHFDTAAMYGNETGVGKGIGALSGFEGTGGGPGETAPYVSREDLFITTKVWNDDHGYDATTACVRHLHVQPRPGIHRPLPDPLAVRAPGLFPETYRALETLYREGKVRAIGVSNFQPQHLDRLLETAEVVPAVEPDRTSSLAAAG